MLKRDIKYETFDDEPEEVTETFYFNISKREMIELQEERKGGFAEWLRQLVKIEDSKEMLEQFKRIILMAYGEKSDDGKLFLKRDDSGRPLSDKFAQHAAFEALYMEMIQNEGAAAEFLNGIFPRDLMEQAAKVIQEGGAEALNAPPVPPTPPQR